MKAAAKTSASKKTAKAADSKETNIPEAENHDIISEVMTIKSRNEEKKAAKPAAAQTAKKRQQNQCRRKGLKKKAAKRFPKTANGRQSKKTPKLPKQKIS